MRPETFADALSFVRHWDKIDRLRSEVGVTDDVLLNPLHFLATTDHGRRSCSVGCWQGNELVGLVYVTEYVLAGLPTGYAVGGDYSGRGLLLCKPEFEALVIEASITHIASRGIHSLHLRFRPRNAAHPATPGMNVKCLDGWIPGDRLPLASDFAAFLGTLGKHTRRNIRQYMRKTTQAGIEFVFSLTDEEYRAGVARLNGKTVFQANRGRLARDERVLALHSGAQRFGLRAADGTLVAVLCGFAQGRRFHLLNQLNDPRLRHLSLSLAFRGHMVAHLIALGYKDLQFLGGASLSLGRFCVAESYRSIFADKKTGFAAAFKRLSCELNQLADSMKKSAPESLKLICNGNLAQSELVKRTALGPAALVFPEEEAVGQGELASGAAGGR